MRLRYDLLLLFITLIYFNESIIKFLLTATKVFIFFYFIGAPKFDTKFNVQTIRRGDKVFLSCNAYGDTPITFTWRKNGIILDPLTKPR